MNRNQLTQLFSLFSEDSRRMTLNEFILATEYITNAKRWQIVSTSTYLRERDLAEENFDSNYIKVWKLSNGSECKYICYFFDESFNASALTGEVRDSSEELCGVQIPELDNEWWPIFSDEADKIIDKTGKIRLNLTEAIMAIGIDKPEIPDEYVEAQYSRTIYIAE